MSLDPCHERLIRLICILPGPDNDRFWQQVASANETGVGYVYDKMSEVSRFARGPCDGGDTVSYLAEYVIKFFGGERRPVWDAIAHHVFHSDGADTVIGRVFAEDLVRTAQDCVVRFSDEHDLDKLTAWATR